jgi:hypothetical protein
MTQQKVADAGAVMAWGGWFMSHLVQLNEVLQFALLLVSIVAGVVAIRYHLKKTPK